MSVVWLVAIAIPVVVALDFTLSDWIEDWRVRKACERGDIVAYYREKRERRSRGRR